MNYTQRYTRTAIALHWIAAVLIIGNLLWGLYMVGLPLSPAKLKYYSWHKWTGVTIFLLAAFRLLWRLRHGAPALPAHMQPWERNAAHASHVLLYVLFFAGPLTGWLHSSAAGFQTVYLGILPIPDLLAKNKELAHTLEFAHRWIGYSLGALVAIHAAAAIKHHLMDGDDVLVRMMPLLKQRAPSTAPPPSPIP